MRRRKRKKSYLMQIFLITLLVIGTSYSLLSEKINIKGIVSGASSDGYIIDSGSNPSLTIDNLNINSWQESNTYKFQYSFYLKNIGSDAFDNFTLTLSFNTEIIKVDYWNYTYEVDNKNIIINSSKIVSPDQSVEINFIVTVSTNNLKLNKIKLESNTSSTEIDNDLFLVNFTISNGWGNYTYQYNVTVQNKTGVQLTYWQISLELPENTNYLSGWNAIFSTNNNILLIKNESYNGRLENNQSTSFGLQLQTNIQNYIPNKYTVMVR